MPVQFFDAFDLAHAGLELAVDLARGKQAGHQKPLFVDGRRCLDRAEIGHDPVDVNHDGVVARDIGGRARFDRPVDEGLRPEQDIAELRGGGCGSEHESKDGGEDRERKTAHGVTPDVEH